MTFAINWDLMNDAAYEAARPDQVREWFQGIRIISNRISQSRITACRDVGLEILAVVRWDSDGFIPQEATWAQVHNEMTSGANPMTPQLYVDQWREWKFNYRDAPLQWMTGGLALGTNPDIAWMHRVMRQLHSNEYPDAIAIHPYTMTPEDVQSACDRWWNEFHIPVAVTEWYRSAQEGHHPFQCVLGGPSLDGQGPRASTWNSFFCLSDHMTIHTEGSRLGLFDEWGGPKDEFYSLISAPQDCKQ